VAQTCFILKVDLDENTALMLLQINTAAFVIGGILIFFASLEFTLSICMGCIIFTYLVLPFYKQ